MTQKKASVNPVYTDSTGRRCYRKDPAEFTVREQLK